MMNPFTFPTNLAILDDKKPNLDSSGNGEDNAYPWTFIECLLRTPSKKNVGTGGSQQ